MKLQILLLLCILTVTYKSQNSKADSLLDVLKNKSIADTTKVNVYNKLSKHYTGIDSRDGLKYGFLANSLAKKIRYEKGLAKSYAALGSFYFYFNNNIDSLMYFMNLGLALPNKSNYKEIYGELLKKKGVGFFYKGTTDSALVYFKNSLQQYELLKDSFEVIKALNNIGTIQLKLQNYKDAIAYFYRCLKYDEAKKDTASIATDYNNIAIVFADKKDFKSSLIYYDKALKIRESLSDSIGIARMYVNIANIYIDQHKHDDARLILDKGIPFIDTMQQRDLYTKILNNKGIVNLRDKRYDEALSNFLNVTRIKNEIGIDDNSSALMGNFGSLYLETKQYLKAIPYCVKGYELAVESGELEIQRNCQKMLSKCYALTGQGSLAVESLKNYNILGDSIYSLSLDKEISETQIKYETEKKEQENKLLQQENNLNQAKLETRNRTIIILVFAIILIIIIVVWRINVSKLKKKQLELEANEKLQKEKERISRDLHDNVGGQLSYVLYSLDDVDTDNISKRKEIKSNINESVRSVIQNLRETIWAINDESLTINDLSDKLKVYSRSMFKNSNTKIIFSENMESDILLNSLVGLNLYRICQEIINNAFKYSSGTDLKITISSNEKVTIVIADNGNGFDLKEKSEGFGLKNIKDRAHEIGAIVTLSANKNIGVTYTIVV
jgi:signal transduction histidine kinase